MTAAKTNGTWLQMERLPAPARHVSLILVTYWSEGMKVKGYLSVPEGRGPCPGLVYCRGGIGRVGMVRLPHLTALTLRGYVVFAPFYRGQASGEGRDEFGGADRHDVYNAIRLLQALPEVAPLPVAVVGFSRGGIMAALAARDCPGVGGIVMWSAVADLLLTYEERVDLRRMLRRVVGHPVKQRDAYVDRSSVYWADRIACPVLLVHGTADANVGVEHARALGRALEAAGKPYATALYDGQPHVFPGPLLEQATAHMDDWIRRQLHWGGGTPKVL